jgi:hypothetical protein
MRQFCCCSLLATRLAVELQVDSAKLDDSLGYALSHLSCYSHCVASWPGAAHLIEAWPATCCTALRPSCSMATMTILALQETVQANR